jgi:hypothetical protein
VPIETIFSGTARSTATIPGRDTFEVWLPGQLVNDVVSVTLDGSELAYGHDYDWSKYGDLSRTSGSRIWARTSTIEVVWTTAWRPRHRTSSRSPPTWSPARSATRRG